MKMKHNRGFFSKKVFSTLIIVFIIAIIAALGGCTSKTTTTTPAPTTPVTSTIPTPTTPVPTATSTPPPTTAPSLTTTPTPTTTPPVTTEPVVPATPQTILSVTGGDIFVMRAGTDNWVLAEAGTTLQPGDFIRCTAGSTAEVTFFEGSTIELNGDTQISLSEIALSDTGSTTIHLQQYFGNTVSRVKKLTDSSSTYEVETQAAVAAVRGSTLDLTVLPDGTTIVANVEGNISVIAQGMEVIIPEGMKSTVIPGSPPGQPESIIPTPTPTGQVYTATVNTSVLPDRAEAGVGETITYTYLITNTGSIQLMNISVTDDIVGVPVFQGGDGNGNSRLDPGEIWIYTASHVVSASDAIPLVNNATFTVTVPQNLNVYVIRDRAEVNTQPQLWVEITSPEDGTTVTSRTITVSGTVSDTAISGSITINGETHAIDISEGGFSTSENVNSGANTITVTVSDGEQTASDTIHITADIPANGIRVELTWDTDGTDVDSHLIRPGGEYWDGVSDCYWDNMHPDWGIEGVTTDDPSLDQDVRFGYGPENLTLQEPYEEGIYQYKVHYYDDNGLGPTTATVRIWINDVNVAEYSKLMVYDEVWDCADIEWPSGDVYPAPILTKTAAPLEVYAGDDVTYTYHVSNAGGAPLEFSRIVDDVAGEATYVSGDDGNETLDPGEVWVFTATYTTTGDDVGELPNTATASFWYDDTEETVNAYAVASVTIYAPLEITTESLPDGVLGEEYSQTLTASGGKGSYHWSIVDGALPDGLELVGDTITGTPTAMGEAFTFTVQVMDDLTGLVTLELTIAINAPGTPTP
jgi:uncharacterized protein YfaP (DUF2135 family)